MIRLTVTPWARPRKAMAFLFALSPGSRSRRRPQRGRDKWVRHFRHEGLAGHSSEPDRRPPVPAATQIAGSQEVVVLFNRSTYERAAIGLRCTGHTVGAMAHMYFGPANWCLANIGTATATSGRVAITIRCRWSRRLPPHHEDAVAPPTSSEHVGIDARKTERKKTVCCVAPDEISTGPFYCFR
jgi:hypothetical protein